MLRFYWQKEQYAESGFVPFAEGYVADGHLAYGHWIVRQWSKIALDLPATLMAKIWTDFPATTSVTTLQW